MQSECVTSVRKRSRFFMCVFVKQSYRSRFVYCRVFVLLIIDNSTKEGVLVYLREYVTEIVNFRSNPYRKHCEFKCSAYITTMMG